PTEYADGGGEGFQVAGELARAAFAGAAHDVESGRDDMDPDGEQESHGCSSSRASCCASCCFVLSSFVDSIRFRSAAAAPFCSPISMSALMHASSSRSSTA